MFKYNVDLKPTLQEDLPDPDFCDLVYAFRKIVGDIVFWERFKKNCHSLQKDMLQHGYSVANCIAYTLGPSSD